MAKAEGTQLRGFDSYRVRLGDELRGERASLGRSLLDVQRDLRIKAAHIDAIENANPSAIPYPGYVTGYVRAYARYLGMDEEMVLRRFCEEAGFTPPVPLGGSEAARSAVGRTNGARADLDAVIAGSRLAAVSRTESFKGELGATLRGLGSLSVLLAVIGGLGYGGWALLQNIQRVDFSPLPDAPMAMAGVPELDPRAARPVVAPVIDDRALAAVYAVQEVTPPRVELRDGPISTIDPRRAGVYASDAAETALRASDLVALPRPGVPGPAGPEQTQAASVETITAPAVADTPAVPMLALIVTEDAWVRVRDGSGRTVHEALMRGGQRWTAPEGLTGLTLRAGNAGAVYVEIDGVTHGPLGRSGGVVSNVTLAPDAIRSGYARAEIALTTSSLQSPLVRAR